MDVSTEINTTPSVAIILGALSVAGTIIASVIGFVVKKALTDSAEVAKLKHSALLSKIEAVKHEVMAEVRLVRQDLEHVKKDFSQAVFDMKNERVAFGEKAAGALNSMKNTIAKGEARFEIFQAELKNQKVLVDRLTKRAGGS